MILAEAIRQIRGCMDRMHALYQRAVFDEWAIVSLDATSSHVLHYSGPRPEDFHRHLETDFGPLHEVLDEHRERVGDFEFNRQAHGTQIDAFLVLGPDLYLLCNHTQHSMSAIAGDPLWLRAQVPFADLAEVFRADPLARLY